MIMEMNMGARGFGSCGFIEGVVRRFQEKEQEIAEET